MRKIRLLALTMGITIPLGATLLFTSCNKSSTLSDKQLAAEAINALAMDNILNTTFTNAIDVKNSLKMVDILIDNRDYEKTITVTDISTQEEPTYANRKKINFKSIDGKLEYTFSLFYNDVTVKEKEKLGETKLKIAFGGLIKYTPIGKTIETSKYFKAKLEDEKEIGESENEVKFKIFNSFSEEDNKFIQLKCEKVTSTKKTEYEYKYEIKNGETIKKEYEIKIKETAAQTTIKLEEESETTEEKIELTRIGTGDNVSYKEKYTNKTYIRVLDLDGYHYEEKNTYY